MILFRNNSTTTINERFIETITEVKKLNNLNSFSIQFFNDKTQRNKTLTYETFNKRTLLYIISKLNYLM